MKILTLKQRIRIRIILFLSIIFAILGFVIYPSVQDILTLEKDINEIEKFLETQHQRVIRMQRSNLDIDAIVSTTVQYTEYTVPLGSELMLIQQFEELAIIHDIEQQFSVAFSKKVDTITGLSYFEFNFLNHGAYLDHLAYLEYMLKLPYIVHIGAIDMKRRNNTAGRGNADLPDFEATLRFKARIYVK
jgi:hypothetical protein